MDSPGYPTEVRMLFLFSALEGEVTIPMTPLVFDVPSSFTLEPGTPMVTDNQGAVLQAGEKLTGPPTSLAAMFLPTRVVGKLERSSIETTSGQAASTKVVEITVGEHTYGVALIYRPAVHDPAEMDTILESVRLAKRTAPIELPITIDPGKDFTAPVPLPSMLTNIARDAPGTYAVCLPVDLTIEQSKDIHRRQREPRVRLYFSPREPGTPARLDLSARSRVQPWRSMRSSSSPTPSFGFG